MASLPTSLRAFSSSTFPVILPPKLIPSLLDSSEKILWADCKYSCGFHNYYLTGRKAGTLRDFSALLA